jgi:hypothetical protein
MISYVYAVIILVIVLIGNTIGPSGAHISMRYYDSILHFLGGAGIGFFLCGFVASYKRRFTDSLSGLLVRPRAAILWGVCIAGIVWEIFEIMYNITGYPLWTKMYYIDTVKDIILDTFGGYLATLVILRKNHVS